MISNTLAIDFDDTLCDSEYPDLGPPKKGAREALKRFKELGYHILIHSCRTSHWHYDLFGGDPTEPSMERDRVKAMVDWLVKHDIPFDEVDDGSRGKPWAEAYIDDKAIQFADNWGSIMRYIERKKNDYLHEGSPGEVHGAELQRMLPFDSSPEEIAAF